MDLTKKEVLKVKTKGVLSIVDESPLQMLVLSAMDYYAKQEAISFANWLSNQTTDSRNIANLWVDYRNELGLK